MIRGALDEIHLPGEEGCAYPLRIELTLLLITKSDVFSVKKFVHA
jgi:hypothetical protein